MGGHKPTVGNLLRPRSIAIVGASGRDGSFGQRLIRSVSLEYQGDVYPINPKYDAIGGLACYPDVSATPARPDCALLAVGDGSIVAALERVAEAGIPSAVIFGRGHGQHEDGRSRSDALASIARDAGMALLGANCMGFINLIDRLQVTGSPFASLPKAGHASLISHSGSTWSGLVGNLRQLRFNYAVSAGQELATTAADYLKFFLEKGSSRVVGCVLETVRDPEGFLEALDLADRQGVPVVVLKLGRSDAGKDFALSHTGALSGSNAAYDAIFERYNVVPVRTLDEFTDTIELLQSTRHPNAPAIGVGTDSGGERQLIVDLATDIGVNFAELSPATNSRLTQFLDEGVEPSNPVDYWGDGGDVMAPCLSALADDPNVGLVVMASNMVDGRDFLKNCISTMETVHHGTGKPVALMGNIATTMAPAAIANLREQGIPVLMGTETALKAIRHFMAYHFRNRDARSWTPPTDRARAGKWLQRIGGSGQGAFSSAFGFELLKDYGITPANWAQLPGPSDLAAFAARTGFPLVLKIDDPAIAHKSEVGGVIVGLRDPEQAQAAWQTLRRRHPNAPIIGQAQSKGAELLLGMTVDAQFGPVVTVGMGGIYVEILRDAVSLIPPFGPDEALARLKRLACWPILNGARGQEPVDVARLADLISRFGTMCFELRSVIKEIEINPLMVGATQSAAVDCLIVPHKESE